MALGKAGADRQVMHERLRAHALVAWDSVQQGLDNPLPGQLIADAELLQYLGPDGLKKLMQVDQYMGDAVLRARHLVTAIRSYLTASS